MENGVFILCVEYLENIESGHFSMETFDEDACFERCCYDLA